MPKFTADRREEIRETLLETGRELFPERGLDGTSIAALTDGAGIATGTFYSFFDSKEELLATILQREANSVYRDLESVLHEHPDDPQTALTRFVEIASTEILTNPLFGIVLTNDDRERLRDAIDEDVKTDVRRDKLDLLTPAIEEWQDRGLVVDSDPDVVAFALIYITYLPQYRDEIGRTHYDAVRRLLIESVVDAVVTG